QKRKGSKVGNGELNGKVRLTRLFCPLLWLALGAECGVERLPRVGASARHPAMAEVPASALSAWRRSIPGKLRSPPTGSKFPSRVARPWAIDFGTCSAK